MIICKFPFLFFAEIAQTEMKLMWYPDTYIIRPRGAYTCLG